MNSLNPRPVSSSWLLPVVKNENDNVYFTYLENSPAPAWITDDAGYTVFMNQRARQIWRIGGDYKSKHVTDLFPTRVAGEFLASDNIVLDTCRPLTVAIESVADDGSPAFYMLHKFLLSTKTDRKLIAGQAIDITAEKIAEEGMRKSMERFSYVAKAVSHCIWDWDMETGKIYRSESLMTLTGYTREEIEGTLNWWENKTHPEDRQMSMDKLKNFIGLGHPYCDAEYRFLCADGSYRHFADKGYIIYKAGKPIRAIGVVQDITEQKKIEAQRMRQKIGKEKEVTRAVIAAQDKLANDIAKELHDNVNQILSVAKLMLNCSEQQDVDDNNDFIAKSKEYISMAIDEIRKISNPMNTSRIKEALLAPVEEILSNLRMSLAVAIEFDFDQEVEQFMSHEQKLMAYRIIQEQTNNIVKYAEATEIKIKLAKQDNSFRLSIKDNGRGFDLKTVKTGTGLVNIKNRVEAFNGIVNIITSPGAGCCIDITMPVTV